MKYLVTLEIDVQEDNYGYGLPENPEVWNWTDLIGEPTRLVDVKEIA